MRFETSPIRSSDLRDGARGQICKIQLAVLSGTDEDHFEWVLAASGRNPNLQGLGLEKLALETILAATDAASKAIEKSHAETSSAARDYAKAAGEARREAWRYFGGFWVWLASVGAGGAVLGLLAAFLIMGRGDAREFGQYPQVYCTTAGGQIVEQDDGSSFCAIWIDRPSQSGG